MKKILTYILPLFATSYLGISAVNAQELTPKGEDLGSKKSSTEKSPRVQVNIDDIVAPEAQPLTPAGVPSYQDPSKILLAPGVEKKLDDKVNTPSVDVRVPIAEILPGVPARESKKASAAGKYSGEAFSIGVGHESGKADKGYPMLNLAFGIGKAWYLNAGTGARGSSSEKPPITKIGTRFDAYGTESSRENESISFIGLDKRFGASYGKDGVYASLGADLYFDNTVVNKSIDEMIKDKAGNIIARSTNYPRYENNKCNVKGKFGIGVNIKNVGIEGYAKGREGEVIIGANIRYCIRSNTKQ